MLLLFAAACLGHLVLMVASHNWFYGLPLPRRVTDVIHALHALLVLAFPVVLWRVAGWDPSGLFAGGPVLTAYVVLCWIAGLGALPPITAYRVFRAKPAALGKVQSEVVDVVKRLGGPPAGVGKNWLQARL